MKTFEEWFDENQTNYKGIKSRHEAIQMLKDFVSWIKEEKPDIVDKFLKYKFKIKQTSEDYYNRGRLFERKPNDDKLRSDLTLFAEWINDNTSEETCGIYDYHIEEYLTKFKKP